MAKDDVELPGDDAVDVVFDGTNAHVLRAPKVDNERVALVTVDSPGGVNRVESAMRELIRAPVGKVSREPLTDRRCAAKDCM